MKKYSYHPYLAAILLVGLGAHAASLVFTNTAPGNHSWSQALNWNPNQVPVNGDTVSFTASGSSSTNDLVGLALSQIIFARGNWFIYGNDLSVGAGGVVWTNAVGSAACRVNVNVTITDPATTITNMHGSQSLNFGQNANGLISGAGGVLIGGIGNVQYYAANSYDGNTVVEGLLQLANTEVIPNGAGKGNVTVNGRLNLNGKSETINGLLGMGIITNTGGACTLTVGDNDATTSFAGSISEGANVISLEKIGGGTLTLSGTNTHSGETKVTSGTIKLGVPGALLASSVNLNGGALSASTATAIAIGGLTGSGNLLLANDSLAPVALTLGKDDASTVTFSGSIDGAGSVNKTNSNRQNLYSYNISSGPITVWQGTLGLGSSHFGTGLVSVKDDATLALDGTSGTPVNVASLTCGAGAGCSLNLGINADVAQPALNVSSMTNQGVVMLNVNATGTFTVGATYPLITYSGSIAGTGTGSFQLGTLPLGVVGRLQLSAGTVSIVVDAVVNSLTWLGSANNLWDTSSVNWQDLFATPLIYTNQYGTNLLGDIVTFDDGGASQPNVSLVGILRPAKMNFSASSTDYSFGGTGRLSGSGQAVKTGSGTVTFTTSNDYTGGTWINQGIVAITHPSALGNESVRLHSTLRFTNAAALTFSNSIYNNAGADMVFDVASGTTATLGGSLNLLGGGPVNRAVLTKVGSGKLVFGGSYTIDDTSARLLINSGDATIVSPMSFGGHAQCIAVANLDNTARLTIDNTTLSIVGNYEFRCADGGGDGTLVVTNNGSFVGNQLTIGQGNTGSFLSGTGRVLQASGNVTLSGSVVLGPNNTFSSPPATPCYGLYQLNGGVLTTTQIQQKDPNVTALVNFNGGTLKAAGSGTLINLITTAQIQSGGLTIDTASNSPSVVMPLSGPGALTKAGAGTLNLNTNNTYTGVTTVAAGSLAGSGSIAGNLVVSGGSFEPGVGVGGFTVGGTAWITNSALFQLNKNLSPSNDLATVAGALNVGGTLIVTNLGGALTNGDYFKLFSKPVSGSFSALTLPTLAPDLAWKNDLAVDGSLSIILAPTSPTPTNLVVTTIPGQVILSWPVGQGWRVEVQTNSRAVGLTTNWMNLGVLTPPVTNAANPANGTVFYRLAFP